MLKKVLLFAYILIQISVLGQNKIDSLQKILFNNNLTPEESLKILEQLYYYTYLSQPLKASEYTARASYICDSVLRDTSLSIIWKKRLADIYFNQKKLDFSVKIYSEIKNYYQRINDSLNYARALYNLGRVYTQMDVNQLALENFNTAKKIFIKYNDTIDLVFVNNHIALTLYNNYQNQEAFKLLFKNLKFAQQTKNVELIAEVYYFLGRLYTEESVLDTAQYYFLNAVKYYKLSDYTQLKVADIYVQIAKFFIEEGNEQKAKEYLNKAEATFISYNAEHRLAEVYINYAKLFKKLKKNKRAIFYYNKSLEIAQKYDISEIKQEIYYDLAQIYNRRRKFDSATKYLNLYIEERNSFFAREKEQGFAQVILMFQNQEKQKEIELLQKKEALKNQQLKNKQQLIYASALVIFLLVIFVIYFLYSVQKQKKINKLLNQQNRQIILQKKEIETQSRILEKATQDLLRQKREIEEKNRKITASIKYASRIQKAMLPSETLFKEVFEEYFIFFKPKETVSGDFYWLAKVQEQKVSLFKTEDKENQRVILAVVDCTGHGVPGAFMAMLGDAYLNQIINIQHITEPSLILSELHKQIRQTLQQQETDNNDGMDMALVLIDKNERTVKFSGAKNPLIYIQNEKMYRIHGDLMSIGGLQKEKERIFVQHTIDITAPTWIYLYTDGFQDQFGGKYGRKYMAKPLRDFLFKIHKQPFEQQKILLEKELQRWMGKKYQQMDDITIIGVKL